MYSDSDIEKLQLISQALKAGESIGQIANLSSADLKRLYDEVTGNDKINSISLNSPHIPLSAPEYINICIRAIRAMDLPLLEATLIGAMINLNHFEFLNSVVSPVLNQIGDLWISGQIKIAHEHAASAVIRNILGGMLNSASSNDSAPTLVATTLPGERHEFGALMAAIVGISLGWRAIYLGAESPADSIANVVEHEKARLVILSSIYGIDNSRMESEIVRLRRFIGPDVEIFVGGKEVSRYDAVLHSISATKIDNLSALISALSTFPTR
jgi:methanogenic corrinoid protein MtbC1